MAVCVAGIVLYVRFLGCRCHSSSCRRRNAVSPRQKALCGHWPLHLQEKIFIKHGHLFISCLASASQTVTETRRQLAGLCHVVDELDNRRPWDHIFQGPWELFRPS